MSMAPTAVSFKTRQQGTSWEELLAFWSEADQLGIFDAGWVYDHLLPIFTEEPGPVLEGWTVLSALATSTRTLGLGVMVSGNTYRNPALLVKMAASVDVISGGRVRLGLGAGWNADEHRRFGFRFPPVAERMDRLDDACQIVVMMVAEPLGATHHGVHHSIDEAVLDPPPVHGRLPLTIGGRGERRTMLAAARWADSWNLPSGSPEVLAHKITVLQQHCEDVGRPPSAVEISVQVVIRDDVGRAVAEALALRAVGAQHIIFVFDSPLNVADLHDLSVELSRVVWFT